MVADKHPNTFCVNPRQEVAWIVFAIALFVIGLASRSEASLPPFARAVLGVAGLVLSIVSFVEIVAKEPLVIVSENWVEVRLFLFPWRKVRIQIDSLKNCEEEFDERQLDSDDGLVFEFESEDGMPKGYWPIMLRLSNRSLKYQGLVLSRTTPDLVVARIKEILLGIKKAEANRQKGSQFNS